MKKDVFWWTYIIYNIVSAIYTIYTYSSETAKRINEMKRKEESLVRIVVRSHLHLQLLRVFIYKRDFFFLSHEWNTL